MKHFQHLEASLRARLECEQKRLFTTNVDYKQNQNTKHNKNTNRYLPYWQANNQHSLSTQNDSQVNISDIDTNSSSSSTSCSGEYSPNTSGNANNTSTIGSSQRVFSRTVGFLCLYAAVVLLLYALIAFISLKGQQQSATTTGLKQVQDSMQMQISPRASRQLSQAEQQQEDSKLQLEARLNQLERYIEVLALNLQSVETRLAEREKCSCSLSCSFNNTKYADGATWQQGCDTCQCLGGKISCSPIKCQLNISNRLIATSTIQGRQINKPYDNCDLVQMPGKCCPVCMKKCKYQNESLRHNQTFTPKDNESLTCKCNDGLIKCEKDVVGSDNLRNRTRNIAVIINEPLRRNLRSTIQKEDTSIYTPNTKLINANDDDDYDNKKTSQANPIADNNKRADDKSKQDDDGEVEDKTSRRRRGGGGGGGIEDAENG